LERWNVGALEHEEPEHEELKHEELKHEELEGESRAPAPFGAVATYLKSANG
jgi:hypothetical protein